MAWETMEKAAEMRAWEATTVASVATTQTGQKTGLGTDDQNTLACTSGRAVSRAPWPR
jgi:hypothetical protein